MALTDNQKRMIESISKNDINSARKCAIACVAEDTTQKNKWFCNRYKNILQSSGANMIELPHDLQGLICVEDVSTSFRENRYYLSEREQHLYGEITRMKKVSQRLMELGIPYINSSLLFGESGTGKTTFGRYVAYKTGLPFCYLNFSSLIDSSLGGTSKNISKAFSYAISSPCVFMLDEIDCISIRRSDSSSSGGTSGEMARITISLMQEFDKLSNDVIVIGATNREDRMDEALLRRFSIKHKIEELSCQEKEEMVRKYLSDINMDFTDTEIEKVSMSHVNQSRVINNLVRMIAAKVESEVADDR